MKREWAVGMVALAVAYAVLVHCTGCNHAPALSPQRILENAGYDQALRDCKVTGKASGSFAVYDACERAESRKVCLAHPELRGLWDQCAAVLP